jgi:ATP-binding cassette subfamily B multidrug efflux pump
MTVLRRVKQPHNKTMSNLPASTTRLRLGPGVGGRPTGELARDAGSAVKRLITYVRPYTPQLIGVGILVCISTAVGLAGPMLIGRAIDLAINPGDSYLLLKIGLSMLGIYLVGCLASILHGILMVGIGQRIIADLRQELFTHLQDLSMVYHDEHRVGDLMSRVTNDTEAINRVLSNGLIQFITNVLLLGGIMAAMFLLNWQLAVGTLILLPLMLWITSLVTKLSRVAFRQVQHNLGVLNAVMEENIAGIRVVQAFARTSDSKALFEVANAANRQSGIKADFISAALSPMFTTMSTITIAATALLGGWLGLQGLVSVGIIATFVVYIMNFFRPMRSIAMLYNHMQSALAGAERIFEVLDARPTVTDQQDAIPLMDIEGSVKFERVTFGYKTEEAVLNDICLEARPGQTIALVGPTGAGKTTIINLLSRFYDANEGVIRIDGHDIRKLQQKSIRSQLGIVLQDTFLFSGTVLENIRYGRLDASEAEVMAAAELANADWFIRRLPLGYQTEVSEQGYNFSMGQRQLLAIARAILANPRILILDEATSSVDTRTEIQIQGALLNLMAGRTAIVIAHRLSTIRKADQVLVIDNGRIIERGDHKSLLAQGGFYYNLYMSQFRHVEEPR